MEELSKLKKSSQRSALISLIGFVIFISSLLFAAYNLKDYKKVKRDIEIVNDSLKKEKQKIVALRQDESAFSAFVVKLLNSTQGNQGNPLKQNGKINWRIIKDTVAKLPSGKRKLAVIIALLTTWKEIPFKLGTNKSAQVYDASGFLGDVIAQADSDIIIKQRSGEKLSEALMRTFKKADNPRPGDLMFYKGIGKGESGNFGLIYLAPGNKNGKGVGIGTLDKSDPLNIYDSDEFNQKVFLGYFRVPYEK